MKIVESVAEVHASYDAFKTRCVSAGEVTKPLRIVRASGRVANLPVCVLKEHDAWAAFDEAGIDRYRCLFGVGDPRESPRCAIEINLPRGGWSPRYGGVLLRDEGGRVHLGRVGGLSGQERWRQFLDGRKLRVEELDGRPVAVIGAIDDPALVGALARFVHEFATFNQARVVAPTGSAWREHLWATLQQRAEGVVSEVVVPVYWKGQRDKRVDTVLVGDSLRVRVTPDMVGEVDRVPREFVSQLPDRHQMHWRWAAEAIRASVGKTVSLNQFGGCICIPFDSPDRRSTSLNVYAFFHVNPRDQELASLLDSRERAALEGALREREQETLPLNQLGHVLYKLAGVDLTEGDVDDDPDDGDDPVEEPGEDDVWSRHRNVIFFGPPGTGKSHFVQGVVTTHLRAKPERVKRVTFHPEYSYFDFVGSYRPAVGWLKTTAQFVDADGRELDREPRTYYRFEPGPFSQALALAANDLDEPVVLVIEELNRGNCAAIFGDVFQLLDRIGDPKRQPGEGWSEYAVVPSAEWAGWLAREVPGGSAVFDPATRQLRLPGNLYLYATMNTSDQSLFPMDTAFRRRWGMSYLGVDTPRQPTAKVRLHAADEDGVSWMQLMQALNRAIVDHTRSDDKQMGPWFIRPPVGEVLVDTVEFKSKVLFYLWATVFRDRPARVFRGQIATYEALLRRYDEGLHVFQSDVLAAVGRGDGEGDATGGPSGAAAPA